MIVCYFLYMVTSEYSAVKQNDHSHAIYANQLFNDLIHIFIVNDLKMSEGPGNTSPLRWKRFRRRLPTLPKVFQRNKK